MKCESKPKDYSPNFLEYLGYEPEDYFALSEELDGFLLKKVENVHSPRGISMIRASHACQERLAYKDKEDMGWKRELTS
jgi:hypothetical protein